MRDKEDAQDYRYFPDPDLVAIKLSDEYIENIRKTLPELPESRKERYLTEYGLSEKMQILLHHQNIYQTCLNKQVKYVIIQKL